MKAIRPILYKAVIRMGFLPGKEFCQYCDFCKYNQWLRRARCIITKEVLPYYESERGCMCPLERSEEDFPIC